MKISVVTATYNSAKNVAHALSSISAQTWPHIEHIVVDGASRDNTLAIVERLGARVAKIVSEPDRGIYDALNKGIALATGDVVGFLHSDDEFADPDVLSWVATEFRDPSVQAVYGDLHYINADGSRVVRDWQAGAFAPAKLMWGWMPPHPSLYLRRSVYEQLGRFDESFRIAADYEFILRLFMRADFVWRYVPRTFVRMRLGGASNRSLKNILRKSREDLAAMRRHGLGLPALALKNLRKVSQPWVRRT
jgi:glycosyltransferase involved in cell wall biosynthesis